MSEETLQGHLQRPVVVDLCVACEAFWFDQRESLRLSPGSTLKLFRLIGERRGPRPSSLPDRMACPRCGTGLKQTSDLQRSTRFEYFRCPNGHGRFTTFFNFLREKDFVRPLSAAQLAELRQNLQTVNCSNCGAPIDLTSHSSCTHCGSPLSVLDMAQAEKLIGQLQHADEQRQAVDPALPMSLARASREVHGAFDVFERDDRWFADVSASGLVGAGLHSLARWLNRKV